MYMNNLFCMNCGKKGHSYYKCKNPITSIGIIVYRFNRITNNYEYLMIQRCNSLGYVDFIRGKYNINNKNYIMNIINEMTLQEKERLLNYNFDVLWNELWRENCDKYKNEKEISKKKFYYLKLGITNFNDSYSLEDCIKESDTSWQQPEWGFPKGRRDNMEKDIDTAYREFTEETGIPKENIKLIENIIPYEEMFTGSNLKSYKHKYFLAKIKNYNECLDYYQTCEVRKIEWKTINKCIESIRPYNLEKKEIIENIERTLQKFKIIE